MIVPELIDSRRFPGLEVVGAHATPVRPIPAPESERILKAIRASGADVVWVGMGTPAQDVWMAANRERVGRPLVGVGSGFDLLSGRTRPTPAYLKEAGLQWVHRLAQEPGQLARRYAVYNPLFVWHFGRQLIRGRAAPRALIRWLPSQVRVTAYFPNLILIAAFLGLGVGALRARNRSLLWLWPPSLFALVAAARALSGIAFTANSVSEHLWLLYADLPAESAPVIEGVHLPIIALFVLSALSFVAPGQIVAVRLNAFRERSSALRGYALDLAGSLVGVIAFAVASYLGSFPVAWFATFALVGLVLFLRRRRLLPVYALLSAATLWMAAGETGQRYSPYYSLTAIPMEGTPDHLIRTNGSLHQVAVGLFRADPTLNALRQRTRIGYHYPYQLLGRPPGRVLILGAGTGNDIAVALDEGAEVVHAIEIDQVILEYGRELHPNRPYDDPRVTAINTDARSYLNETDETYDLIVFGTLDSMTRLSALSNVRLDNFVYTRDALEVAARRLRPEGGVALYFMVGEAHIDLHLASMLTQVFGEMPAVAAGDWNLFNRIYLAGSAFAHAAPPAGEARSSFEERALAAPVPTDDWPYLYLPARDVNGFYLTLMIVFLALAAAAVAWASPELRAGLRQRRGVDVEMFLFGLAFLLMETRFVTAMSLAWGATWLTSAVVFGAILGVILIGTLWMELRPIPWRVASAGLIVTLLASWLVPTDLLLSRDGPVRLALSAAYVGAPIFFAAACFGLRFQQASQGGHRVRLEPDRGGRGGVGGVLLDGGGAQGPHPRGAGRVRRRVPRRPPAGRGDGGSGAARAGPSRRLSGPGPLSPSARTRRSEARRCSRPS